ncbi:hypothetical protein NEMBOFW57_000905 [Staphylotrichum longicolle]|uniref:Methyltransferase n=1 Tax=Staphylotrichum longicolle TaxID=669026 RepID=A0AAD4F1C1_9PEZI|nr:hypothetical protein NEMBOFW57_000905 [Staphylotrichum longicolle]
MSSGQAGSYSGTQDMHWEESPSTRQLRQPLDVTDPYTQTPAADPIEIEGSFLSPEVRALLEEGTEAIGLEVDEDGDDEADEADEEEGQAGSVYAMSMYPGVQPGYQVEHPYENGQDSATIDSARTLYAEDFDFVVEHGRQYCGDYFLPIDQTEQTRQYVIHQVYLKLLDLELTTVPLETPRYILDIGTGIAKVPFNIEFHIENAEDEWIRPADTVDLVHIRNMEGAFSDWPFLQPSLRLHKTGRWIEVIDWEDFFADCNYLTFFPENSAPHVLIKAVLEAAEVAGKPRDSRHLDKSLLIDAGFVDIQETVHDLGIGSRENPSYGKFWLFAIVTGFEATCLRLLTKYLGWDAQEVRDLCDKVAHETKRVAEDPTRVEPFVVKLRVVVGRKPTVPGQWTARTLGENGEIKEHSGDESTIGERTIQSEETA